MDHREIEDKGILERYLQGRLGEEGATEFEAHLLECGECFDAVRWGDDMGDALRDAAAQDVARTAVGAGILAWLARASRGRTFQTGLAVALLALVVLPWAHFVPEVSRLSSDNARLEGELGQVLAPQTRTPVYSLSPERSGPGEEPSTRITIGPTPEWVVLALQLPPSQDPEPTTASYRVRLFEAAGDQLWESGQIEPDAAGRVTLSVHSSWLAAPEYVMELDAMSPEGAWRPVARFAFRVRRGE